jgi:hypothetical protein
MFFSSRYFINIFIGIIIDTRTTDRSTASYNQFVVFQKIQDIRLDRSGAGETKI